MEPDSLVFVYGTLKQGGDNHALLRLSRFIGCWRTRPEYSLYDLGDYPAVVAKGKTAIQGELYRVDAATLRQLDRLEDYPVLYDRQLIDTEFGQAWIYLMNARRVRFHPVIQSGLWKTSI